MAGKSETEREDADSFILNREIAYKGTIGKLREEFCISYIKYKQEKVRKLERAQINGTAGRSETITCKKGCSFCCVVYTKATIQECETIVYYLYQNQSILNTYLQNYARWRERLRAKGDLFRKPGQPWNEEVASEYKDKMHLAFLEEERLYGPRVPCPFLHDHICSIYEVRPYLCAAWVSTTPSDWCNPSNPNEPHFYQVARPQVMSDLSFYYKRLNEPFTSIMAFLVYEILKHGFSFLSEIPGMEGLADEARNDPEVKAILKRYA